MDEQFVEVVGKQFVDESRYHEFLFDSKNYILSGP